jgi:hypothetical protein
MLPALPRSVIRRGDEPAQQAHHVVIMLRWRRADAEHPVEQVRVGAIEQRFKPIELGIIQALEKPIREHAEDEVALLRPAMPASEHQPPVAGIRIFKLNVIAKKIAHGAHAFAIDPPPLTACGVIAEGAAYHCLPSNVCYVSNLTWEGIDLYPHVGGQAGALGG